jgi:hypothetical protein
MSKKRTLSLSFSEKDVITDLLERIKENMAPHPEDRRVHTNPKKWDFSISRNEFRVLKSGIAKLNQDGVVFIS